MICYMIFLREKIYSNENKEEQRAYAYEALYEAFILGMNIYKEKQSKIKLYIVKEDNGKPLLISCCDNRYEYFSCSLSHGKNKAVAMISDEAIACGVDVEEVREKRIFSDPFFKESFLHNNEKKLIHKGFFDDVSAYTLLWSQKEALLKAIGIGLSLSPQKVDMSLALCARSGDRVSCYVDEKEYKVTLFSVCKDSQKVMIALYYSL